MQNVGKPVGAVWKISFVQTFLLGLFLIYCGSDGGVHRSSAFFLATHSRHKIGHLAFSGVTALSCCTYTNLHHFGSHEGLLACNRMAFLGLGVF